jgi:hypothetical protein
MKRPIYISILFLIVIGGFVAALYLRKGNNRFDGLKNNRKYSSIGLKKEREIQLPEEIIRLFRVDTDLYFTTAKSVYRIDSDFNTSLIYTSDSSSGGSVWSIFKRMDTVYLQLYPEPILVKLFGQQTEKIALPHLYHNAALLGNEVVGYFNEGADGYLEWFDLNNRKVAHVERLSSQFSKEKNYFSSECFPETIEGNFASLPASGAVFYCYYNSYFILIDSSRSIKLHMGIDSIPIPKVKLISSKISDDVEVSKCVLEDDRFVSSYGQIGAKGFYLLSNVKNKEQRMRSIDLYDRSTGVFKYSILLDGSDVSDVDYFCIDDVQGKLYVVSSKGKLNELTIKADYN